MGSCFFLQHKNGHISLPGVQKSYSLPARLMVEIPEKGRIILIANGKAINHTDGKTAAFEIEKEGIYRIEVYKKSKAWIYSNPFPIGCYPF